MSKKQNRRNDKRTTPENKDRDSKFSPKQKKSGEQHDECPRDKKFPNVPECAANSIEWHNRETSLYEGATKIQTFKMAGSIVQPRTAGGSLVPPNTLHTTNKIIAYNCMITPGYLNDTSDPFNKCMIDLFNAVRGRYTSQIPFQANDLGTVIIAIGSIIAEISQIKRAFKLLRWNAVDSWLTPELLHAAALGTAALSTSAQMHQAYRRDATSAANLAFLLDVEIARLQGLCVPKMAFFDFCGWVFRYAYYDDKGATRGDINLLTSTQMYFWDPQIPVRGATGVYASGLKNTTISGYIPSGNSVDISCHISMLHDAISALVQDDSVRTISGWLKQNFADTVRVDELANVQDTETPENGEEMEYIIRGLKSYTGLVPNVQQDITKEILYGPLVVTGVPDPQWLMNHVVNFPEKPDDAKIMMASIAQAASNGNGDVYTDVLMCRGSTAYTLDINKDYVAFDISQWLDESSYNTCYNNLVAWSAVNTKPTIIGYTVVSSALSTAEFLTDISYQVPMDFENVKNMHIASMMSLFKAAVATK